MIVTGIECPVCRERIWSRGRHDFRWCQCEYCFIDGGRDYPRWGYGCDPGKHNEDMTSEDWSNLAEANDRLGQPTVIQIEV